MAKDPEWLQAEKAEEKNEPRMVIDVPSIRAISIAVRGKRVFRTALTQEQVDAGENLDQEVMLDMEPIVMEHGRHAVLTFKLKNGTKQRYRGNGGVILGPPGGEPTDYAKAMLAESRMRQLRLEARRKLLGQKGKKKTVKKVEMVQQ